MKRRTFILLSGLGISGVGVSLLDLFDVGTSERNLYARPRVLSQLCDSETIKHLGDAYLQLNPPERDKKRLMKKLFGRAINVDTLRDRDIPVIEERLENFIKNDFSNGATVILKGWILSFTEARQCALYTMLNA
jgi:hypothetical protein